MRETFWTTAAFVLSAVMMICAVAAFAFADADDYALFVLLLAIWLKP